MKKTYFTLVIITAFLVFMGFWASPSGNFSLSNTGYAGEKELLPLSGTKKILVAYFSRTGNTREIATQIHKSVGGDIFEIRTIDPYPADYEAVKKQAKQEQQSGFKPKLKTKVNNISSYDLIFIGSPVWWAKLPPPVVTFLSEYDLSGKTIVPFCTHLGSGQGQTVNEISKLCPESIILEGIAVWGSDVKNAQNEISDWLRKIKITK